MSRMLPDPGTNVVEVVTAPGQSDDTVNLSIMRMMVARLIDTLLRTDARPAWHL